MQPTPANSPKSKLRNRAKALAVLLSPFLAAAALTALLLTMTRHPQGAPAEQTKQSGWLSPTSSVASVEARQTTQGATTVTTYTVTGQY